MPFNPKDYPSNWKEISQRIRERDEYKCKFCGAPHGETVTRVPQGFWSVTPDFGDGEDTWVSCAGVPVDTDLITDALECGTEYGPEGQRLPTCRVWNVKVVLTCAHILNKHDKHDVRDENLASLCQSCHLDLDKEDHVRHARETRQRKAALLQPALFEVAA